MSIWVRLVTLIVCVSFMTLTAHARTTILLSKSKALFIEDSELTSSSGVDCIAFFDLLGTHSQSITKFIDRSGSYDDEQMILAWDQKKLYIVDVFKKKAIGEVFFGKNITLVGHLHLNPSKKNFMRISYRIKNKKIFSDQLKDDSPTLRRTLKYKNGLYTPRHPLKYQGNII